MNHLSKQKNDLSEVTQVSWKEQTCVICSLRWRVPAVPEGSERSNPGSDGQFPAEELLTLMDTTVGKPPKTVVLCSSCSVQVGKLQALWKDLTSIQQKMLETRRGIATKIKVPNGQGKDDCLRACLLKRWRSVEPSRANGIHTNNGSTELGKAAAGSSIIPGLIAKTVKTARDKPSNAGSSKKNASRSEQVQYYLDPGMFKDVVTVEVVEGHGMNYESSQEYEGGDGPIECIDLVDEDEIDRDEVQVDMSHLIPQVEINESIGLDPLAVEQHQSVQQPPPQNHGGHGGSLKGLPTRNIVIGKSTGTPRQVGSAAQIGGTEIHSLKCSLCSKVGTPLEMIAHMDSHFADKLYRCSICHKRYSDRNSLDAHLRDHEEKRFGCTVCFQRFHTLEATRNHAVAEHPGITQQKISFRSSQPAVSHEK